MSKNVHARVRAQASAQEQQRLQEVRQELEVQKEVLLEVVTRAEQQHAEIAGLQQQVTRVRARLLPLVLAAQLGQVNG